MDDINTCQYGCYDLGCKGKCEKKKDEIPVVEVSEIDWQAYMEALGYVAGIMVGDE